MNSSESIIVKLRVNRPRYFTNIAQHVNFLNKILEKNPNPLFYLEIVDDGILHIFANFEAFKNVHMPVQAKVLEAVKKVSPDRNFLLNGIYPPNQEWKAGIVLTMECIVECSDDLFPLVKRFYESIHPSIQVSIHGDLATVFMPEFDAFMMYANLIYANIEVNQ